MKIHLSTGVGHGPTMLAAFDAALYATGIHNYNLLRLSSVIPPNSTLVQHEGKILQRPGEWGDRLYVVMAEAKADRPNQEAWAGIGWVQDAKTKKGLFVEHHGGSETQLRKDITDSLESLMRIRRIDFGKIHMRVQGAVCTGKPLCVLAVAAYQVSDWKNQPYLYEG